MFDREALRSELRSRLRGYSGIDASKLFKCPNVLEALHTNDGEEAVERLVARIRKISPVRNREALLNALAIPIADEVSGEYAQAQQDKSWQLNLTYRREWFGQQWGGKNHETVETWENEAINYLVHLLMDPTLSSWAYRIIFWIELNNDLVVKDVYDFAKNVQYAGQDTLGMPVEYERGVSMTGPRWQLPFFVYDVEDPLPSVLEFRLLSPQEPGPGFRWPTLTLASSFTDAMNGGGRRLNMETSNSNDDRLVYERELHKPQGGTTILVTWTDADLRQT